MQRHPNFFSSMEFVKIICSVSVQEIKLKKKTFVRINLYVFSVNRHQITLFFLEIKTNQKNNKNIRANAL